MTHVTALCQWNSFTFINNGELTWNRLVPCNVTDVNTTNSIGASWNWEIEAFGGGIFGSKLDNLLGNNFNNFGSMVLFKIYYVL